MKATHKKASKFMSLVIAIAVLCAFFPFSALSSAVRVHAYDKDTDSFQDPAQTLFASQKLDISNASFADPETKTYSTSISGWTQVTNTASAVPAAVLNTATGFDDFKDKNNLTHETNHAYMKFNPLTRDTSDYQVLALANRTATASSRIGYESSDITLYGDGFFEISVDFYAVKGSGSAYLIASSGYSDGRRDERIDLRQASNEFMTEEFMANHDKNDPNLYEYDQNRSTWQTATFLVKTDLLSSTTVKVGLFLGTQDTPSSGVIYFDNVRATAHSAETFGIKWNKAQDDKAENSPTSQTRYTKLVDLNETTHRSNSTTKPINIAIPTEPEAPGFDADDIFEGFCEDNSLDISEKDAKEIYRLVETKYGDLTSSLNETECAEAELPFEYPFVEDTGDSLELDAYIIELNKFKEALHSANLTVIDYESDYQEYETDYTIFESEVFENFCYTYQINTAQTDSALRAAIKTLYTSLTDKEKREAGIPIMPTSFNFSAAGALNTFKTELALSFKCQDTNFLPSTNFDNPDNLLFKRVGTQNVRANARPFVYLSDLAGDACLNLNPKTAEKVYGNESPNNKGAALLTARESKQGLKLIDPVTINRNTIYMISFYALATENTYMRIRDSRSEDKDWQAYFERYSITPYNSGFFTIKTSSTDSFNSRNNWVLNTVFITGECFEDTSCDIEFWVGGEEDTTAYLIIDDFAITRVSHDYYEKHMEGSNASHLGIDHEAGEDEESGSSELIANAHFNNGTIKNVNAPFPLRATGWTHEYEDENLTRNGIVNTEPSHWNTYVQKDDGKAYGLASYIMPSPINSKDANNNIYMIQNMSPTFQKMTSGSFVLGTSSTNIISFNASTYIPNASNTIDFWAILEINGKEVARIDMSQNVEKYTSHQRFKEWDNYKFTIKTSQFKSPSVTLSFLLGDNTSRTVGVAFIDNIRVTTTEGTDTIIDARDTSSRDLSDPTKIASVDGTSLSFIPEDDTTAGAYLAPNSVLELSTYGYRHTKITNTITEEIEGGNYYEYTIWVAVGEVRVAADYSTLDEKYDYGVNFTLDGMDGGFKNVTPSYLKEIGAPNRTLDDDTYAKYYELKFFINSLETFDLSLVVEFGNENVAVDATVSIKKTELKAIEETDYTSAKELAKKSSYIQLITTPTSSSTDDETTDSKKSSGAKLDFLIIPSLIMSLAIIVAVVGTIIRRSRFKFHIRKHHTSYSRDDASMRSQRPKKSIKATKAIKVKTPKEMTDKE